MKKTHMYLPNTSFSTLSSGGKPNLNRACFIDFFPLTRERHKGFIREHRFEERMKDVIRECIVATGGLTQYKKINADKNYKTAYYQEIKEKILNRSLSEEWRMPSEMMYGQSRAYYKTAVKEGAIQVVTASIGKGFGKALTKNSGRTVNKFIEPGTKLNKIIGQGLGKTFKGGKGILSIEFQGIDYLTGEVVKESAELVDNLSTSSEAKQYKGYNFDLFGNNWYGNTVDFIASQHPAVAIQKKILGDDIVRKTADVATDLTMLSWFKTGVTVFGNIYLGSKTEKIANQMKAEENRGNASELNQKLKQTVHDDVFALHPEEIKKLIDVVGLARLTK